MGFWNFKGPSFVYTFALLVVSVMQCVSTSERSSLKDFFESQVVNIKAALLGDSGLSPVICFMWVHWILIETVKVPETVRDISEECLHSFLIITLCESCHCWTNNSETIWDRFNALSKGTETTHGWVRCTIKVLFFYVYCSNYFLIKLRIWL